MLAAAILCLRQDLIVPVLTRVGLFENARQGYERLLLGVAERLEHGVAG